jgi:hypothetical protein
MQTVNFKCGSCGNLMAVTTAHLGLQVRCPHCQQVVVAPSAAPSEPPPIYTQSTMTENLGDEEESIFAPPTDPDDIFGRSSAVARVEMPTETTVADPPPPSPAASAFTFSSSAPPPGLEPTLTYTPPGATEATFPYAPAPGSAGAATDPTGVLPSDPYAPAPAGELPSWMTSGESASPPAETEGSETLARELPRPTVRAPRSSGLAMALFIVPLFSWAILATVAVAILYLRKPPPHPLEMIPDVEGDNPGVIKLKRTGSHKEAPARAPLPDNLKVKLGDTFRIGDVEVTPLKVEFARITLNVVGVPSENPSLLLYLRARNVAPDYIFSPFDSYFARSRKKSSTIPLMRLEVGEQSFIGGPAVWKDPKRKRQRGGEDPDEWVRGQELNQELKPGEEATAFLCTDPDDRVQTELTIAGRQYRQKHDNQPLPLLWRVQVRRGLVSYNGKEIPTTALIGVLFHDTDIAPEKEG